MTNWSGRELIRPFAIDLSRLETYSAERLRELVPRYEKYVETLSKELACLREDRMCMQDEMQQLEEITKDCSEINISLNNRLAANEELSDIAIAVKIAIGKAIEDHRAINLNELVHTTKDLDFLFKKLEKRIKIFHPETWEEGDTCETDSGSHKSPLREVSEMRTELASLGRVLEEALRELSEKFLASLSSIASVKPEEKALTDLVLVSKSRWDEIVSSNSRLRSMLNAAEAGTKAANARAIRREGEARDLRIKLKEAVEKQMDLESCLRALGNSYGKTPADLKRILETMTALQQENNGLAKKLKELRAAQLETDRQLIDLRREKKELVDKNKLTTEREIRPSVTHFDMRGHRQSLGPVRGPLHPNVKPLLLNKPLVATSFVKKQPEESLDDNSPRSDWSIKPGSNKAAQIEKQFAKERAAYETKIAQKNEELETALKKLAAYEKPKKPNFLKQPIEEKLEREESLIFNENLNESLAETNPRVIAFKRIESLPSLHNPDMSLGEVLRKLHMRLKGLYKNFVMLISQDRNPKKEELLAIEKQLNDTLEGVMLFIS